MNCFLSQVKRELPDFNERPLTEEDFWKFCKRKKVIVFEEYLEVRGYYERRKGRDYILINRSLHPLAWLHTAFHELSHLICDVPALRENAMFYHDCERMNAIERRADTFARMMMIPLPALATLTEMPIEVFSDYERDLLCDRWADYKLFGI